ncbi:MAG: polyphenol oxidase family protein [Deinococcus sp.]
MIILAPTLQAAHGFSTRAGGVSRPPFAGLNLGDPPGSGPADDPETVERNRERFVAALGFTPGQVARLRQVHGSEVALARPGVQTADALVTSGVGLLLAVASADCYPLLLEDPGAGVLGAAHAGWRGTALRVAARTVEAMTRLGADPARLRVAVGPGISAARYRVGAEVAGAFRQAGLGDFLGPQGRLDLAGANKQVLQDAGVPAAGIWLAGRCSTEPQFYSHRRDHGVTGRMWAAIGRAA